MYIAKMHTNYPEFHGKGYYNFLISLEKGKEDILSQIENNSHDFHLVGVVRTRHKSLKTLMQTYPTKYDLNRKFFQRGEDVQV